MKTNILKIVLCISAYFFIFPTKSEDLTRKYCEDSIKNEIKILKQLTPREREGLFMNNILLDINNDRKNEILVSISDGGNSSPPVLKIIFFNSNCLPRKYTFSEFNGVWNSWEGVEFINTKNGVIIKTTNHKEGIGYTKLSVDTIEYIFDGENVTLLSKKPIKSINAISEMLTSNLNDDSPDSTKRQLLYDLNNDKKEEIITCNYWSRWGRFQNCVLYVREGFVIKMDFTPKRLGVLEEKINNWQVLVVDNDTKYFFDTRTNNYKKLNE